MPASNVLSVSDLTRHVKKVLDQDPLLQGVLVKGEISNFRRHSSGHLYFTLKDEFSQVRCVMFRSNASKVAFAPENGMEVIVGGYVTVYERDGQYQLYAESIQPYGVGAYHIAFEQLKKKLEAEGLFDRGRKRPLPLLPRRVGIITSLRGAAVRDMVSIARRRFPGIRLLVADVVVQGEEAPPRIIAALSLMNRVEDVDVVIVGRGGGSVEELWAFNDERLARAIAASRVPVVSAVGHETDFTIADFVADCRAPTPSAAAELVAPDVREIRLRLADRIAGMGGTLRKKVRFRRDRLSLLVARRVFTRPRDAVERRRQMVDEALRDLQSAARTRLSAASGALERAAGRLDALSPLSVLRRGYSVVRRRQDGALVASVRMVEPGDAVSIRVADGDFEAEVRGRGEGG